MKTFIKNLFKLTENPQPPAVFRLSDDVLISIFMLGVEQLINIDNRMVSKIPWDHRPILQCTTKRTSQVCRRWRLVALTCPALWSNIELSCTNQRWMQEMMNRAMHNGFGRLSLTCYSSDDLSKITPELLSHAYSYYGVASVEAWSLLTNELASPTTKLDSLFVFPSFPPYAFDNVTVTPSLIFDKPSLQRLSFDCCFPIDIIHSNLPSLTTLVIQNGFLPHVNPEVFQFTISEMLSALANMPLLLELLLSVSIQNSINPLHSISLPSLARLKLQGRYFSIYLLLSNITFPLSCSLIVSCKERNITTLPTNDMLYHIATPVAKNMAYGFTHNLHIFQNRGMVSVKELPLTPDTIPRNRKDDGWDTELQWFDPPIGQWKVVFDQIISCFNDIFQTTTHLTLASTIDVYFHFPAFLVLQVLQPFIALVSINLDGYSKFSNLISLFKSASKNGEEILPALRSIELSGLTRDTSSFEALICFLAWRFKRDEGLHTFEFHFFPGDEINVTWRQLSRIQQFVVDINVYYIKTGSDDFNRRVMKTKFLPPRLRTDGFCRLERFRDIPHDRVSNKRAENRKYFLL